MGPGWQAGSCTPGPGDLRSRTRPHLPCGPHWAALPMRPACAGMCFWRRATVQSASPNAPPSASRGARTTGTSVSSGTSGATVSGARSTTRVLQVAPQVEEQRDGGGKRARWHLGGAARGGRGRARQDASRDEDDKPHRTATPARQPPLKGAPHRPGDRSQASARGSSRRQRSRQAALRSSSPSAVLIPSTTESRKRVMVKPPCESSRTSRDSCACISKMCATGGHRPGEGGTMRERRRSPGEAPSGLSCRHRTGYRALHAKHPRAAADTAYVYAYESMIRMRVSH